MSARVRYSSRKVISTWDARCTGSSTMERRTELRSLKPVIEAMFVEREICVNSYILRCASKDNCEWQTCRAGRAKFCSGLVALATKTWRLFRPRSVPERCEFGVRDFTPFEDSNFLTRSLLGFDTLLFPRVSESGSWTGLIWLRETELVSIWKKNGLCVRTYQRSPAIISPSGNWLKFTRTSSDENESSWVHSIQTRGREAVAGLSGSRGFIGIGVGSLLGLTGSCWPVSELFGLTLRRWELRKGSPRLDEAEALIFDMAQG